MYHKVKLQKNVDIKICLHFYYQDGNVDKLCQETIFDSDQGFIYYLLAFNDVGINYNRAQSIVMNYNKLQSSIKLNWTYSIVFTTYFSLITLQ